MRPGLFADMTPRGRAMGLVYVAGWLGLTLATVELFTPPLTGLALDLALTVEIGIAAVILYGIVALIREGQGAAESPREVSMGWDGLVEAQARMRAIVADAQVHIIVVPLLFLSLAVSIGLALANLPHPQPSAWSIGYLALGYAALSVGGMRAVIGFWREGRLLRRLAAADEAPEA